MDNGPLNIICVGQPNSETFSLIKPVLTTLQIGPFFFPFLTTLLIASERFHYDFILMNEKSISFFYLLGMCYYSLF